jgi:hypothetical protein
MERKRFFIILCVVFFFFIIDGVFINFSKSAGTFNYDMPATSVSCGEEYISTELERVGIPDFKNLQKRPIQSLRSANVVVVDYSNVTVLKNTLSVLAKNFKNLDKFFLHPFRIDYIVVTPSDATLKVDFNFLIETLDLKRFAGRFDFIFDKTCVDIFQSNIGTRVIFYRRTFKLPDYLLKNLSRLDDPDWLYCAGKKWALPYVTTNAYNTHHLLLDPFLEHYDYTFQVMFDIFFLSQPDVNPIEFMERTGGLFLHTQVFPGDLWHDCQENVYEYTLNFGDLAHYRARSEAYSWCKNTDWFYGNFVGFSSRFLRSRAAKIFNSYLYECTDGYFKYRWGDQASWTAFLCQWLDIPDLANDSQIVDFSYWRNKFFLHG